MIFSISFNLLPGSDPSSGVGTPLPAPHGGHQVLWRELSQDFLLGVTNLLNQTLAVGFDLPGSFSKKGAKLGVISKSSDETVGSGLHLYFLVIYASCICKPYFRYIVYT